MRRCLNFLALAASLVPALALAQDVPAGIRGEMIESIRDAGGKIQELATAIPDGKYTWKPSKDVRSTGQVFLHVVQANYMLPSFFGVKPTMSRDELAKLDSQTMEPARIREMLKESYAWAEKAIADTPDSSLDTKTLFFDVEVMTKRAEMLALTSHSHGHLGQLIAYARSNNIVPPWTARELAQKKKDAEKKDADKKSADKSGK